MYLYSIIVRERIFLDRFRCIDHEREVKIFSDTNIFRSGGLVYLKNGFNVSCISIDDIINYPVEFEKYMEV